jgi:hypothetical protein
VGSRGSALAAFVALLACGVSGASSACGSFASSDDTTASDGGTSDGQAAASEGAAPDAAGGPFRCPSPAPANTDCWDFEGTDPIAADLQGDVVVTREPGATPAEGSWMKATAAPLAPEAVAFGRVLRTVPVVTPSFDVVARVRVAAGGPLSIVRLLYARVDVDDRHELSIESKDGALTLSQGTFIGGNAIAETYGTYPIATLTPLDAWHVVHMNVSFAGNKTLTSIDIDGTPRLGPLPGLVDPALAPTDVIARFGLEFVYDVPAATTVRFDDVRMKWTLN